MRAISLISQLEFHFSGNVARNAVALGDADNDGESELVIGNENGEMVIFKGKDKWQKFNDFSFITCIAIGDILNVNQNCVAVVTADGWCHLYYCLLQSKEQKDVTGDDVDGQTMSSENAESEMSSNSNKKNILKRIHVQRIPANTMDIVIGDIDGDGLNEIVFGLTDRVVRSYRWHLEDCIVDNSILTLKKAYNTSVLLPGRLVGLNKWECANQIGSITLHHSISGKPCLLVSQPGGTFMRITTEDVVTIPENEIYDDLSLSNTRSEKSMESSVDYQFLGISRMRNQIVYTEILGDLNDIKTSSVIVDEVDNPSEIDYVKSKPYSLATLDGTIMLVQNEVILWAIAVDHQIFALEKIDITERKSDDVVATTWDGYTYILDQDKNSVRFQVGESIQAFCCGHYTIKPGSPPSTCLVYVTFKNKVRLYYDIPLYEMVTKRFEPKCDNPEMSELLKNSDASFKRKFVEFIMYGIKN